MSRPIDGDELLRIERLLDTDVVRKSKTASWLLDQVLHDIQTMPTLTPQNEWVSVEERLPERGKDVLLYFEEESRISVGGRYDVGDGWYAVIVNEYETICDTSPRSWMPLPAPPDRRPPEGEANG